MKGALAFLALLSCAGHKAPVSPDGVCVTPCGLRYKGTCEELEAQERRVLWAFEDNVPGWQVAKTCAALEGWTIVIHTRTEIDRDFCEEGFKVNDFCAIGLTHDTGDKVLELEDSLFRTNAFSHELVHVIDLTTRDNAGHCAWTIRGIKDALRQATGTEDPSKEGCVE